MAKKPYLNGGNLTDIDTQPDFDDNSGYKSGVGTGKQPRAALPTPAGTPTAFKVRRPEGDDTTAESVKQEADRG